MHVCVKYERWHSPLWSDHSWAGGSALIIKLFEHKPPMMHSEREPASKLQPFWFLPHFLGCEKSLP